MKQRSTPKSRAEISRAVLPKDLMITETEGQTAKINITIYRRNNLNSRIEMFHSEKEIQSYTIQDPRIQDKIVIAPRRGSE